MKKNNKELDVDYIGSQEPLSKEQENILKEYFKKLKDKRKNKVSGTRKSLVKKVKTEK
jgi:predicted RNA-binding protein